MKAKNVTAEFELKVVDKNLTPEENERLARQEGKRKKYHDLFTA